mmetsp:Transcript_12314/g.27752  ORF Transcript_12314/g.27752 Transcript_12314/m.27752 type:complete len:321 (+) Transcript_12314:270-1232(+)
MSHNHEEDQETEERLTAESYGALDTSMVEEQCWLVRVPQKLSEAWDQMPEGSDLGELVFTKGGKTSTGRKAKPVISVHVAEEVAENLKAQASSPSKRVAHTTNALPLNYSLQAMTPKIPVMHPFSRNPRTGSIKLWGTVSRTANLQVEKDSQYRALLKDRLMSTTVNNSRYVKPVEATESVMSKQRVSTAGAGALESSTSGKKRTFGDAVLQFGQRRLEATKITTANQAQQQMAGGANKKSRKFAPDQPLRSVIFELFSQSTFWAVKDLKAAAVAGGATQAGTRKGESEIREQLREIGEYHRSGDHKNMWELRKEFQQQN